MPGIYLNDGGATASALGDALGRLAQSNSPQAQAEAQLLRYRTEGQDISNQTAYNILKSRQDAAVAAPGFLQTFGADAQPPGAQPPSGVASTLAGAAQPPGVLSSMGARVGIDTSAMTPFQKLVASRIVQGDFSPQEQTQTVELGQHQTRPPGQDYGTQTEVAKARQMPYDLTAGTERHIPGAAPGAAGGGETPGGGTAGPGETVVSGPSEYGSTVARTTGASNPASAEHDIAQGADADANLGKAKDILALYDRFIAHEANPLGILKEGAAANLSAYLGIPVERILKMDVPGVKAEIRARFASMVSNLRDNMGQPLIKGGLDVIMRQFPDPDQDPVRFHSAVEALKTTLQQQKEDGQAAMDYYSHATNPKAYVALLQRKAANAANARAAFASVGVDPERGAGGGGGGGEGGGAGGGGKRWKWNPETGRTEPQ